MCTALTSTPPSAMKFETISTLLESPAKGGTIEAVCRGACEGFPRASQANISPISAAAGISVPMITPQLEMRAMAARPRSAIKVAAQKMIKTTMPM